MSCVVLEKELLPWHPWLLLVGRKSLCLIEGKLTMVLPKLKNKIMSNKPSRGIGTTHMEEVLILGNMAWKSLGIGIQFHMGYQSLSLFYFIFHCIKSLLLILCKFALISSQFLSFFFCSFACFDLHGTN